MSLGLDEIQRFEEDEVTQNYIDGLERQLTESDIEIKRLKGLIKYLHGVINDLKHRLYGERIPPHDPEGEIV